MDDAQRSQVQFSLLGLLLVLIAVAVIVLPWDQFLWLSEPQPVSASGTVTLDGVALDGAVIGFVPIGAERFAGGLADLAGYFTVKALPGRYRVAIVKDVEILPLRDARSGELIDTSTRFHAVIETKRITPDLFANPETSGLTAEVTSDGPNVFSFNLTTP
jgi:hypothetical protein